MQGTLPPRVWIYIRDCIRILHATGAGADALVSPQIHIETRIWIWIYIEAGRGGSGPSTSGVSEPRGLRVGGGVSKLPALDLRCACVCMWGGGTRGKNGRGH